MQESLDVGFGTRISQEQDFMLLLLGPSRLSLSRAVPFDSCNCCQRQQQDPKPTSRLSFTCKLVLSWRDYCGRARPGKRHELCHQDHRELAVLESDHVPSQSILVTLVFKQVVLYLRRHPGASISVNKRRCLCSFLLPWNNIWFHHFRPPPNDKPQCIHTRSLSEGRYDDLIELLFFFSHLKASSNNSSGEAKRANRERWTS